MPVSIEQIRPGAVFRFKTAARRVTSLSKPLGSGFNVNWEYADRLPRAGKRTGSQWVHYFRANAIEEIPDPGAAAEQRKLIPLQRLVGCQPTPITITLETRCPDKYAIVDLETGELWGHTGDTFRRLSEAESADVAYVAGLASRAQGNHPDDQAGDSFAAALKAKLAEGRAKGRSGWDDPDQCSTKDLAEMSVGQLRKGNEGNFLDIASFAMMLHERQVSPAELAQAASRERDAIRGVLDTLVSRYDDHELRPRLAEIISEIDTKPAR